MLDEPNRNNLINTGMQEAHRISSDAAYEAQDFINELEKQELMTESDKNVWLSMVDYITLRNDGKVELTFLMAVR